MAMSDVGLDYIMDEGSMMDIEPDSDFDEVSSQYDSCYSSGRLVMGSIAPPPLRALTWVLICEVLLLCSDNTTTLFSEVTNYKYEHGRRLALPSNLQPASRLGD
jgi:hypothetical protein